MTLALPRLRVLMLAPVLAPVLFFGMTFSATPAAMAYATAPSPVEVGKTILKSPPGKMVTTVGSLTPWGRAAKLALLAYSTKDAWWPVVEGFLGDKGGTTDDKSGTSGCAVQLGGSFSGRNFNYTYSAAGSCSYGFVGNRIEVSSYSCKNSAGQYVTGSGGSWGVAGGATGSYSGTLTICGVGLDLAGIRARVGISSAPTNGYSSWVDIQTGWPKEATKQETTVQCKKPDGSIVTITDSTIGQNDRVTVPSCIDRVPGSIPWDVSIKAGPNGGAQKEIVKITTKQDVYGEYADCFGPSGLQCVIRVWVDGQPCTVDRTVCHPWRRVAEDPETAPRVKCKFGGHEVDLDDCIGISYKPDTPVKVITTPNPDGSVDVDPEAPPKPKPDPTPPPYEGPRPTPNPENAPPTDPSTTNPDSKGCLGEGISFNPVSWVYTPVKCAFIWAFVPKRNIGDAGADLWDRMKLRAPFSFVVGLGQIQNLPTAAGPCPDWRIKVGPLDQNIVCDSSYVQAIRAARPALAAMMIVLALWPLIRGVMYASVPVIKPMPGGR